MGKGLAIVIGMGKPKGKPTLDDDSNITSSHDDESGHDEPAGLLFDALKDDDRSGFIDAFKLAVQSCKDDYDDAGNDDDGGGEAA